jgi:hypothetical protein
MYLILLNQLENKELDKVNFNMKIPGIISFFDFYQHLLDTYDSVSFGDCLFMLYLLMPLQQYCPLKYRKIFWSQYFHLLKYVKLSANQSFCYPIENFLRPYETDSEMISVFVNGLFSESPKLSEMSHFGYLVAVNHVNSFLFDQSNGQIKYQKEVYQQIAAKDKVN